MLSRPFRFERAERFADACELLRAAGEGAKVLAGGQSLLPLVNLGLVAPELVVDISRVAEGRELEVGDGYLAVGALVTHTRLGADPLAARFQPLLGAAARRIGNLRVRNRGTLGGSLAHSDPAAELPLAMVALGARYRVTNGSREREIKAEDFHLSYLSNALQPDELVVATEAPVLGPGWGWSFQEISRRAGDFALAAVAVLTRTAGGVIVESRVAAGAVNDRPVRLGEVEAALGGAPVAAVADRIGPIHGIRPAGDSAGSAEHRARLCRVLVGRAVAEACRRSVEAA